MDTKHLTEFEMVKSSFGTSCLVPGVMGRSTFTSSKGWAGLKAVWVKPTIKLRMGGEWDELDNAL